MLYLLLYSDSVGSREEMVDHLNNMSQVENWRYDIAHSFFVVSSATAQALSDELRRRTGKGRFLFVQFETNNRQGYLPKEGWDFIKKNEE